MKKRQPRVCATNALQILRMNLIETGEECDRYWSHPNAIKLIIWIGDELKLDHLEIKFKLLAFLQCYKMCECIERYITP